MELNYNSTSSKLYRWFYDTNRMPETLCPYFWKLVFAWTLTVILSPLLLPTWILRKVTNDFDDNCPVGPYAFIGLIIYTAAFAVIGIGVFISAYWITYYQQTIGYSFYITGGLVTLAGAIFLIIWSIVSLKSRIQNRIHIPAFIWDSNLWEYVPNPDYVKPKPNLFIEFIKAKYNKYCPKIDWK